MTEPAARGRFPAAAWSAVGLVAAAVGAWALLHRGAPAARLRPLAAFTERHVAVAVALDADAAGGMAIVAAFTPQRAGDHLYSKDLPRAGLGGVGRPTLVELVSSGALTQTGPLTADRTPTTLYAPALATAFPVYPDGPVTLRMPVARAPNGGDAATLSLTYMACSRNTCWPPVEGKQIRVSLAALPR